METLEIKVGDEIIKANKIMTNGFDKTYYAIVGRDLYTKKFDGSYVLKRKNFLEDKNEGYRS